MNKPTPTGFASHRQRILDSSQQLDRRLDELAEHQSRSREAARQADLSRQDQAKGYGTLVAKTSAACHEIVQSRSFDEWSMAFCYLANYLLAQLARAETAGDEHGRNAALFTLGRLSDETKRALPQSTLVLDAWQRSITALGESPEPSPDPKPHPHADSLSRIVLLLRDTGPKLELREIYVSGDAGLHVVRPA